MEVSKMIQSEYYVNRFFFCLFYSLVKGRWLTQLPFFKFALKSSRIVYPVYDNEVSVSAKKIILLHLKFNIPVYTLKVFIYFLLAPRSIIILLLDLRIHNDV